MPLRLIEMVLPTVEDLDQWRALEPDVGARTSWEVRLGEGRTLVTALVPGEDTEAAIDLLSEHLGDHEGFHLILLPVEAALPRPNAEPVAEGDVEEKSPEPTEGKTPGRISREELYEDVIGSAELNRVFLVMVALSAVVAAIGLLRDSVAIIIGAMVIAPLLGPNMALALATTLGDAKLARGAALTNVAGVGAAFALALVLGLTVAVDPEAPEIAMRTAVTLGDLALALAAGCAGALAFTAGVSSTLVGVMVAVALLPPLMTFGMLLGAGHPGEAMDALMLLATNVICVNLAGVATFVAQGIRPGTWWEEERARRLRHVALAVWTLLLLALVALIVLARSD